MLTIAIGRWLDRTPATRAQIDLPRLWPSFTMVYSVREVDIATNTTVFDQTRRLTVVNEYNWQEDVIRDGIEPREAGSMRSFQNQTVCYFSAAKNHQYCHDPLPSGTVTSVVVPELSPTALFGVQAGRGGQWRQSKTAAPWRTARVREAVVPCPTPPPLPSPLPTLPQGTQAPRTPPAAGLPATATALPTIQPASCQEIERVEFAANSVTDVFTGGIAVFGERRVGNYVVHEFRAESLQIHAGIDDRGRP
ncbi:MAG: hypothetical protein AB7N70_39345 [Dehalococcoidia bacterium]